ncbi:MAG: SatD family protein [Agriterribacter sp.]
MIAVITGDVVNSRSVNTAEWQPLLKKILKQYGKEPVDWELYRGDSFQLRVAPEQALWAAIHIKAGIKQLPQLDARTAIGIGTEEFKDKKITTSAGSAFIRSGECFDMLKKQNIAVASGNESFDEVINLLLSLSLLTTNNWSATVALAITTSMENAEMSQTALAAKMNKSQSSISEALKRGGYEEVKQMELFYRKQVKQL